MQIAYDPLSALGTENKNMDIEHTNNKNLDDGPTGWLRVLWKQRRHAKISRDLFLFLLVTVLISVAAGCLSGDRDCWWHCVKAAVWSARNILDFITIWLALSGIIYAVIHQSHLSTQNEKITEQLAQLGRMGKSLATQEESMKLQLGELGQIKGNNISN
jgi:hypothetical protein